MRSFRDFDRPFHGSPVGEREVAQFERCAAKYGHSVALLSRAIAVLESACPRAHASGRRELDYIIARTRGYREHLRALIDIAALYRRYHELFARPRAELGEFTRALRVVVGDAELVESRTRRSADCFAECVSHTTDLGVLWMICHKMVLGSQCLRMYLGNVLAFYEGRDYWTPVPWDTLFGRSVFPVHPLDPVEIQKPAGADEPG
jgi:hypothetical protein